MSAIAVGEVAGGIVSCILIIAAFVVAILLSKRGYSLTTTFKISPRPVPRPVAAEQPAVRAARDRGVA